MRERFEFEGTSTGEYRGGLYVTYNGREHSAVYLGIGRYVLYSDMADENFTFPVDDGRYLMQTDIRDELLTRACEVRMVGVVRECYETVMFLDFWHCWPGRAFGHVRRAGLFMASGALHVLYALRGNRRRFGKHMANQRRPHHTASRDTAFIKQ